MNLTTTAARVVVVDEGGHGILLEILGIGGSGEGDDECLEVITTKQGDVEDRGAVIDGGPIDVCPDVAAQVSGCGSIAAVFGVLIPDSGAVSDCVVVAVGWRGGMISAVDLEQRRAMKYTPRCVTALTLEANARSARSKPFEYIVTI